MDLTETSFYVILATLLNVLLDKDLDIKDQMFIIIIIAKETRLLTSLALLHKSDLLGYAVQYVITSLFSILILQQDSSHVTCWKYVALYCNTHKDNRIKKSENCACDLF